MLRFGLPRPLGRSVQNELKSHRERDACATKASAVSYKFATSTMQPCDGGSAMRTRALSSARLSIAFALGLSGCTVNLSNGQTVCAPDTPQDCPCADGSPGTQTCLADGSGFGECSCSCVPACKGRQCGDDGCGNPDGCGTCTGQQVCGSDGFCIDQCKPTETKCGTACVDTRTNNANCGSCGNACTDGLRCVAGSCTWLGTNIKHVVLIAQENHTFDAYFGRYCTAPAYSNPSCTDGGRGCCEAAPDADPATGSPAYTLTDNDDTGSNYAVDRNHDYTCEVCQINGGKMDGFTGGGCPGAASTVPPVRACSDPYTFMVATSPLMDTYWSYADQYTLADRYFQPIAGGTSSNDMFFAVSHVEFVDNQLAPKAIAANCTNPNPLGANPTASLAGRTTIADLLLDASASQSFRSYADGYAAALASSSCPSAGGAHCHELSWPTTDACRYDPSDVPFQYYPRLTDDSRYIRDMSTLYGDIDAGTLPSFAYVKFRTSENEHPGWSYISDGESNVAGVVDRILGSASASDTLILLTWDEGGGFYDHISTPASVETFPDGTTYAGKPVPYGTRVPLLAIGRFAKAHHKSHVRMEHSSIVKFVEWNFLGPRHVGDIARTWPGARDGSPSVNNLGSMLDSSSVGVFVPQ